MSFPSVLSPTLSFRFFFLIATFTTFTFQPNSLEVYPQQTSGQAVVTGVYPCPRYVPLLFVAHRVSAFPLLVDLHRMYVTHALALSANQCFMQQEAPTSVHSARLEPTKLILMGWRTTYQATGDAGGACVYCSSMSWYFSFRTAVPFWGQTT